MTALNAIVEDDSFIVSMDTLVSTIRNDKRVPLNFTQKFQFLPFVNSVICGTGNFNFLNKVFDFSHQILANDATTFTKILSNNVQQIAEDPSIHLDENNTATLYIFGFGQNYEVEVYALRNSSGFKIETILNPEKRGFIIKPNNFESLEQKREVKQIINQEDPIKLLVELMRFEKSIDDNMENKDSVGIGGENIIISVSESGSAAVTSKIDAFEDYSKQYEYALSWMDKTY